MQSALVLQVDKHAVAPHTYGLQGVTAPDLHRPNPSHAYPVCVPFEHVLVPQLVPLGYSLQADEMPLHTPFFPHPVDPSSGHSFCGSRLPMMSPQVPSVPSPFNTAVQASQIPAHAVLQHTPSTQLPLAHCDARVHSAPTGWSALQVLVPVSQYDVATHSVSDVQVVAQLVAFAQV